MKELASAVVDGVVRVVTETFQGSGVVVSPNGLIMTANHVVEDVSQATVELYDGRKLSCVVTARHFGADLALLSTTETDLKALHLGDSDSVSVGDPVVKVGYSLGIEGPPTVNSGTVSAIRPDERFGVVYFQTDAPLNPGDSGGPLLNRQGEVIGIISWKYAGSAIEGMGYAVAVKEAKDHLSELESGETVCQPIPQMMDGSTWRNSKYGYKVTFPHKPGWRFYEASNGAAIFGDLVTANPFLVGTYVPYGVIVYVPEDRGDYGTLADFLTSKLKMLEDQSSSLEVLAVHRVCHPAPEISEACEVEAGVTFGTVRFHERWLLFFAGGQAYFLEGFGMLEAEMIPDYWSPQEDAIDTILYSFHF